MTYSRSGRVSRNLLLAVLSGRHLGLENDSLFEGDYYRLLISNLYHQALIGLRSIKQNTCKSFSPNYFVFSERLLSARLMRPQITLVDET